MPYDYWMRAPDSYLLCWKCTKWLVLSHSLVGKQPTRSTDWFGCYIYIHSSSRWTFSSYYTVIWTFLFGYFLEYKNRFAQKTRKFLLTKGSFYRKHPSTLNIQLLIDATHRTILIKTELHKKRWTKLAFFVQFGFYQNLRSFFHRISSPLGTTLYRVFIYLLCLVPHV